MSLRLLHSQVTPGRGAPARTLRQRQCLRLAPPRCAAQDADYAEVPRSEEEEPPLRAMRARLREARARIEGARAHSAARFIDSVQALAREEREVWDAVVALAGLADRCARGRGRADAGQGDRPDW